MTIFNSYVSLPEGTPIIDMEVSQSHGGTSSYHPFFHGIFHDSHHPVGPPVVGNPCPEKRPVNSMSFIKGH